MTSARRRIAITRKLSLAPYGDDFDDCFVVVTLADFQEKVDLQGKDIEGLDNVAATQFMLDTAKKHFVSGKIRVLNDEGVSELVDMEKHDIASSERIISDVYLTVMGVALDPKATPTETATSLTPTVPSEPSTDENNTKTT